MQSLTGLPRLVARQLEMFEPFQNRWNGNSGLQSPEWRPQAKMNAMAECNVRIGISRDVEPVRLGELLRVVIRRADHRQHEFSRRNRLTVHLNVVIRHATDPL